MKRGPGLNDIAIAINAALTATFALATLACYMTRRYFREPAVRDQINAKFDRYR